METWHLGYGGPFGGKLVEGRGVWEDAGRT